MEKDSKMIFVDNENINEYNKNNIRVEKMLKELVADSLTEDFDEKKVLKVYEEIDIPLLMPISMQELPCVYRSRFVDPDEDVCSPQTFSYIPQEENKKKPAKRKRMNLTGQSLFYSSRMAGTNYKEIRLDVQKGDVVYVSQWKIANPESVSIFPLFKEVISRICDSPMMKGTEKLLMMFYNLMLKPYAEGDDKAYLATAVIANKILGFHLDIENLPLERKDIFYDCIAYPSVQAKSDKEFNVVFKPEAVDKYLKLNYVIKGTVNEDMHSMNIAEMGFNHDGRIVWYRMEIDKGSLRFTECIVKCVGNVVIQCNNGDLYDENDLLVDIEEIFDSERSFFYDFICQKAKEKFEYDKIVDEASFEKEINRYVVGENINGWRYKKSDTDLPVDMILFSISYRIQLIPITM